MAVGRKRHAPPIRRATRSASPPADGRCLPYLADRKRDQRLLRLAAAVRSIELIHFERATDAVAGEIFKHREGHDVVTPGLPELSRRERPRHFMTSNANLAANRHTIRALHA